MGWLTLNFHSMTFIAPFIKLTGILIIDVSRLFHLIRLFYGLGIGACSFHINTEHSSVRRIPFLASRWLKDGKAFKENSKNWNFQLIQESIAWQTFWVGWRQIPSVFSGDLLIFYVAEVWTNLSKRRWMLLMLNIIVSNNIYIERIWNYLILFKSNQAWNSFIKLILKLLHVLGKCVTYLKSNST